MEEGGGKAGVKHIITTPGTEFKKLKLRRRTTYRRGRPVKIWTNRFKVKDSGRIWIGSRQFTDPANSLNAVLDKLKAGYISPPLDKE